MGWVVAAIVFVIVTSIVMGVVVAAFSAMPVVVHVDELIATVAGVMYVVMLLKHIIVW